jgi:NH3-dependent NAD+ synthetase
MPVKPNMTNALLDDRIAAIRKEHEIAPGCYSKAELDTSGGVDSLALACILVLALGPENVVLVHSRFNTASTQTERAQRLAEALGCPLNDVEFSDVYESILGGALGAIGKAYGYQSDEYLGAQKRMLDDPTIKGSIRSTLRAPIGRMFLRLYGATRRHGTGNECEDRWLRFYQKGGDGEVDSNPLAMLTKGEVYQLCWLLSKRLPKAEAVILDTIKALPSPDLWGTGDGHSDEDELLSWLGVPFTYSRIDTETGQYASVGSIERVSRFLDWTMDRVFSDPMTGFSCMDDETLWNAPDEAWERIYEMARGHRLFEGVDDEMVIKMLKAARHVERITRHKKNPNIPTYGSRKALLEAGILTNDLPVIGGAE